MLPTVGLKSRFTLTFKMKRSDLIKVTKLLDENGFIHSSWQPTAFPVFVEFRVECTVRQAEIIRLLIRNFNIYE